MSLNSSRPSRTGLFGAARGLRAGLAVLLSLGLLAVAAACGMDAQTLKPYTPGEGVNVDVGNPSDPKAVVHVRNLLIVSKAPGEGIVSASLVTDGRDQLTGITGVPIKADGTEGAPFTATIPNTVSLANDLLVVLTDGTPITVKSPDIAARAERHADPDLPVRRRGHRQGAGRWTATSRSTRPSPRHPPPAPSRSRPPGRRRAGDRISPRTCSPGLAR